MRKIGLMELAGATACLPGGVRAGTSVTVDVGDARLIGVGWRVAASTNVADGAAHVGTISAATHPGVVTGMGAINAVADGTILVFR